MKARREGPSKTMDCPMLRGGAGREIRRFPQIPSIFGEGNGAFSIKIHKKTRAPSRAGPRREERTKHFEGQGKKIG